MSTHDVDGLNAGYARALLDDYLENPEAVPSEWRALFESGGTPLSSPRTRGSPHLLEKLPHGPAAATATPRPRSATPVPGRRDGTRTRRGCSAGSPRRWRSSRRIARTGILPARLDPLGSEPVGEAVTRAAPALEAKLTPELQAQIPAAILRVHVPGETLADVLPQLAETYCSTIAYELEHLSDHQQRVWLRQAIESGRYRQPLAVRRRRCSAVSARWKGWSAFSASGFLGQKQFSVEGLDVLIPMLDETIELAAEAGAHDVVLGMAHRGRLNVLAHTIGTPYESILREFEGERTIDAVSCRPGEWARRRQVPPHGRQGTRTTASGKIGVRLVANPSHLEAVGPGCRRPHPLGANGPLDRERCAQPSVALAVLLHGDAARERER